MIDDTRQNTLSAAPNGTNVRSLGQKFHLMMTVYKSNSTSKTFGSLHALTIATAMVDTTPTESAGESSTPSADVKTWIATHYTYLPITYS